MDRKDLGINLIDDLKINSDKLEENFTLISSWLKKVNDSNYYVTYFDPERIIIRDDKVSFPQLSTFDEDNIDFIRNSNIKSLTSLFLGVSLGHNSSLLPFTFFENNYDKYKDSLSPNMKEYVDNMINLNQVEYYSEFIKRKNQNASNSVNKSNALIKATTAGKAYYNNENAFACTVALPAISIIICIVVIFLFIYFI